ncbi:anthranilate synthase component I [Clostridium magnum]|uniref:Anthranilate synthase component 1 n=1 Tax=Clostridium magnum DSM 2767 TaxID=1121326 RepID=A0A161WGF3_9CLOT|nr:anthranilate synthase component I [Clostridium magnum]KZL90765.1 anthranilate synthase component 1 [Clostridium magnum DSM 2767]SHJ47957.1 anthranilate synthase component 1 [Clostridium magnum DSM 2767]
MISLSEKEFKQHKKFQKVFPLYLKVNADQLTPIGIYYSLRGENKFLFESVYSETEISRYSFIGVDPYMNIKSYGEEVIIENSGNVKSYKGKVLDYVKKYVNFEYESSELPIPFVGGAIGYVGYDVIRQYEKLPHNNEDELKVPEAYLMFYKIFICYDHFEHKMSIVYNVLPEDNEDYNSIVSKLNIIDRMIKDNNAVHEFKEVDLDKELQSNVTEEKFCSLVEKAKEYIKAGDIFQVVLSQRLRFKTKVHPFDVYRRLRSKNPSPYLFYIDFADFQIAGSSPESLVAVQDNRVITNPIAGTRVRGKNLEEDMRLKEELLEDEKEKAEHVMLVDLGRNDIGRISEFGTVKLDRFMDVDFYSHVMHIVSKVSGELKKGLTCFEALSSCLPVGTVSGAPKIRAMEIIDELEETKRGIYAGAVGYFSYNGNMDTCIAIRTILFKDEYAYVQAGAGIVYDSVPKSEYIETLNKAMAMKEVI